MSGLMWHLNKPGSPLTGDCYNDITNGNAYIWDGSQWAIFTSTQGIEPGFIQPSHDQLEKHPALKRAWEELIIIKKLLGV